MTKNSSHPALEDAIALAALAHKGQTDKGGAHYILHPLRLALKMKTVNEMMVAVLHDVLEDTSHTAQSLAEDGYPEEVISAVERLTRRAGETYEGFINRVKGDPLAVKVKLADLEDNMDMSRLSNPLERDMERLAKYRQARQTLLDYAASHR
jgi:(p)ppGpp synthase/HD superfamily hydrolase